MENEITINGVLYVKKESDKDRIRRWILENQPENDNVKVAFAEAGDSITLTLPNANREWTFAAWDWAKRFVQEFPKAYPIHHPSYKWDMLYISISNYTSHY